MRVLRTLFRDGVGQIRQLELECAEGRIDYEQNRQKVCDIVKRIAGE